MNKENSQENIELTLPINAAYVSAVRLTASSIAYRMGFEIDCIEDIKAAVSEACTFIIKKASKKPNTSENSFKIIFNMKKDALEIYFQISQCFEISSTENEMSLLVLKALVDNLDINYSDNKVYSLTLLKYKKENIFEKLEG